MEGVNAMPEFAEVNKQVRWLRARVTGWTIASHGHTGAGHFPELKGDPAKAAKLSAWLDGATLDAVTQRGKHVVFRMSTGVMVSHLMFKGRWSLLGEDFVSNYKHHAEPPTAKSASFWMVHGDGARLSFHDPEYRGRVRFHAGRAPGAVEELRELGPDVLQTPEGDPDFAAPWDLDDFSAKVAKKRTAIKALLLDQGIVAGIGNMYACEALYRAGVAPTRAGSSLSPEELRRVFEAAQGVVRAAIDSDLDYDRILQVYKRELDPAGRAVEVADVGGRDTYWVPAAQR